MKNRIVMPAVGVNLASEWGVVTCSIIDWYVRRARGGAGLIITEAAFAATLIDPLRSNIRSLRVDDDCYIPGLTELAEAVHDAGGKIGIQLSAGAGAQASDNPWLWFQPKSQVGPIAPSPVFSPTLKRQPRELRISEVRRIVELCGLAAGRIKQAGFDAIEIHAHGGYLIAEFMSPYFNKRRDEYGGNLEGRLRFLTEIIQSVRKYVGPQIPLIVKYSIDEFINGGRNIAGSQAVARYLQQAGIDAICISSGVYGAKLPSVPPMYVPEGCFVYLGEAIKAVVDLPIIVPGRLGNPILAEQVLSEDKADFIGMARPLIADPDLPRKLADGHVDEIRRCIACNQCRENLFRKRPVRCTVNAVAGRETEYDKICPALKKKRIIVIGGGPAGMEATRVAALRGHRVTLYEKSDRLGGGINVASIPPHKENLNSIIKYYSAAFRQLYDIKVKLGEELSAESILRKRPDAVIIATGGTPIVPASTGSGPMEVVTAFDVLTSKVEIGETVVIAGGGLVGCETANFLAGKNKKVMIVELLDQVAANIERWTWLALKEELSQGGVEILTGVKIGEITGRGVILLDKEHKEKLIKADTLVIALGLLPANKLERELTGRIKEIYTIGDAKQPGTIGDAISDGFITGYNV